MKNELMNMSEESLMKLEADLREDASTVEEILECLVRTEKGLVKQTIENVLFVMEHDPILGRALRKNELTGRMDIVKEMPWKRSGEPLTEADGNQIRLYLEHNYGLTSERCINIGMGVAADRNSYHPIRDVLESLTWDGIPRIRHALHHFLGADENDYVEDVMKMHMLAAISRVYTPGCKYDIVLSLVGPQGGGKSTFFRFLAIKDEWFTDDLRRLDDKRVFEKMNGHWIIELSEMSALVNAKSIEETKSFVSRQSETYRMPYDKYAEDHRRQNVFCGTSNDARFLPFDRSGNRRFAPVEVHPDRAEIHPMANEKEARAYIMQMWAEAMVIYQTGTFELTFSEEMEAYAREMQRRFMPEDTEIGQVEDYLESNHITRTCVKEIYCEVMGHFATDEIQPWESKKITDILTNLGWNDVGSRKFKKYGSQKAWEPVKKEDAHCLLLGFTEVTDDDPDFPF